MQAHLTSCRQDWAGPLVSNAPTERIIDLLKGEERSAVHGIHVGAFGGRATCVRRALTGGGGPRDVSGRLVIVIAATRRQQHRSQSEHCN
ncbi:MAG: hypothetical protein J4N36_06645, partial [Chloroflexi bacterium]|nr:hypothetical protein [Chloroflexota bacterium]